MRQPACGNQEVHEPHNGMAVGDAGTLEPWCAGVAAKCPARLEVTIGHTGTTYAMRCKLDAEGHPLMHRTIGGSEWRAT